MALALTSRRIGLAAGASTLAAMALAAAVAGRSCRVTDPGPDEAVRDMIRAAKAGERQLVFDLLTPETQARLKERAQRATDLGGASMRYTAMDLISIGTAAGIAPPTDITVLDERNERAVVEVVSATGRSRVELSRIDGRWRVDLSRFGQ
jgi:hypothetical protein